MINVTTALPRKILTSVEREFLKKGNRLLPDQINGRILTSLDLATQRHYLSLQATNRRSQGGDCR